MRDNYYKLQFSVSSNKRIIIQKLLLIAAFLSDFFSIMFLIDTFLRSNLYLTAMLGMIALSTIMRVVAMRLNYSYTYILRGDMLLINKNMSLSSKKLVVFRISDVADIKPYDKAQCSKNAILALGSDELVIPTYSVMVNNKLIIMHIDDYLMSVLVSNGERNVLF